MMEWLVQYMEKNRENWKLRRIEQGEERKMGENEDNI